MVVLLLEHLCVDNLDKCNDSLENVKLRNI